MLVSSSVAENLAKYTLYNTVTLHFPLNSDIDDIGSSNIMLSSLELSKDLIDGSDFKFGGCVASEMKIKLLDYSDSAALVGETVQVKINAAYYNGLYPATGLYPSTTLYPEGRSSTISTPIFYGKIESAERDTKNRNVVQITAYDAFYHMAEYDASSWCRNHLKDDFSSYYNDLIITDILEKFGVTKFQNNLNGLQNSVLSLYTPTVSSEDDISDITYIDLLSGLMELVLGFCTMDANGKLCFSNLSDDVADTVKSYKDLTFEDYTTAAFGKSVIVYKNDKKNAMIKVSGGKSSYEMDNIYTRLMTENDATALQGAYENSDDFNLFESLYSFRPFEIKLFSYWWLEPGDKIEIKTPFDDVGTITTVVLSKEMSGFETTLRAQGERIFGKDELG